MNELVGVDMCYGINFFEWSAQRAMLHNALQTAKAVTEALPPELQVKVDADDGTSSISDDGNLQYCPPAYPETQPSHDVRHALNEQPQRRRKLQLEIQKADCTTETIPCSRILISSGAWTPSVFRSALRHHPTVLGHFWIRIKFTKLFYSASHIDR